MWQKKKMKRQQGLDTGQGRSILRSEQYLVGRKKKVIKNKIWNNSIDTKFVNRLKTIKPAYFRRMRTKFKKQKRYSIIYKTLKIFNKFYEKKGAPVFRRKWRIRKPFFLMTFFLRRYIKRYYGRLRNRKLDLLYRLAHNRISSKGYFFFRYFSLLESLLPVFLTRLGLFRNPMVAKVYIKKGIVFINKQRMYNINYCLKSNDLVQIDSSFIKEQRYLSLPIYYKGFLRFYKKKKNNIAPRYRYTWPLKANKLGRSFLFKRVFLLLEGYLKQALLYLKQKKVYIITQRVLFSLLVFILFKKILFVRFVFTHYKMRINLIKLKSKFIYRLRHHRVRKVGRFKRRLFRPFAKLMAAGFSYNLRIRLKRFLLNVEYSSRLNTFIYIKPPIWENLNMYLMNSHVRDRARYSNTLYSDMFIFLLDNYKKGIL